MTLYLFMQNFHQANGVVFQAYTPQGTKGAAFPKKSDDMKVTYDGCVFDGNQQGPTNKSGIPLYGVVSILTPYSPTVFQNCIFRNNDYQADENGYAILSEGSTVTLKNTHMDDNNHFTGDAVQVHSSKKVASPSAGIN